MKVDDASKAQRAGAVRASRKAAPVEAPAPAPAVDEISVIGVPPEELTPRVREALTALVAELRQMREELKAARVRIDELEQLADADPFLGVLNRRAFTRELSRAIAMVDRYRMPAALVFADLNDLKKINDALGHAAGDAALKHVAAAIAANIRQTDAVGRLGGDEFGIILTQSDLATASLKAQMLTELVAAMPVEWEGETFGARLSCGVVEIKGGVSVEEALQTADSAMYAVKKRR